MVKTRDEMIQKAESHNRHSCTFDLKRVKGKLMYVSRCCDDQREVSDIDLRILKNRLHGESLIELDKDERDKLKKLLEGSTQITSGSEKEC